MAVGFTVPRNDLHFWDGAAWSSSSHPSTSSQQVPRPMTRPPAQKPLSILARSQPTSLSLPSTSCPTSAPPAVASSSAHDGLLRPVPMELQAKAAVSLGDPNMPTSTAQALLECHYSIHGAFLLDQPLLDPAGMQELRQVPCIAVQGQSDMVCPPGTAFDLHSAWPEMQLRLVPNAGHSMYDPAITHELLEAADVMKQFCGGPLTRQRRSALAV